MSHYFQTERQTLERSYKGSVFHRISETLKIYFLGTMKYFPEIKVASSRHRPYLRAIETSRGNKLTFAFIIFVMMFPHYVLLMFYYLLILKSLNSFTTLSCVAIK